MTASPITGFLTKKEVEELFGRSHRSLTRDFSSAVRVGDADVLKHLKVRTDDGEVRKGTDVTLEQIQELSNAGLTPTWFIERAWAEVRYGRRNEVPKSKSTTETPKTESQPEETVIATDDSELVRRLEGQITDLKRDKDKLYDELGIKNEQIKAANERTRESNVLMKELQTLLADVQKRALLPLPNHNFAGSGTVDGDVKSAGSVVESGPAPKLRKQSEPATDKSRSKAAHTRKAKSTKPSSKTKTSAKVKSQPNKSKPKPKQPKKPTTAKKHKWYETPTLKKFLSRS